jgi:hypothetical protein
VFLHLCAQGQGRVLLLLLPQESARHCEFPLPIALLLGCSTSVSSLRDPVLAKCVLNDASRFGLACIPFFTGTLPRLRVVRLSVSLRAGLVLLMCGELMLSHSRTRPRSRSRRTSCAPSCGYVLRLAFFGLRALSVTSRPTVPFIRFSALFEPNAIVHLLIFCSSPLIYGFRVGNGIFWHAVQTLPVHV